MGYDFEFELQLYRKGGAPEPTRRVRIRANDLERARRSARIRYPSETPGWGHTCTPVEEARREHS